MLISIWLAVFVVVILSNSKFARFATVAPEKEPDRTIPEIIIYILTLPVAIIYTVKDQVVTSIDQLFPAVFLAGGVVIIYDLIITLVDIYRLGKEDRRWMIYKFNRFGLVLSSVAAGILIAIDASPDILIMAGISSFFFCMVHG